MTAKSASVSASSEDLVEFEKEYATKDWTFSDDKDEF